MDVDNVIRLDISKSIHDTVWLDLINSVPYEYRDVSGYLLRPGFNRYMQDRYCATASHDGSMIFYFKDKNLYTEFCLQWM